MSSRGSQMMGENDLENKGVERNPVLGGREVLKLNERRVKTRHE